jgi:hypothetical protein
MKARSFTTALAASVLILTACSKDGELVEQSPRAESTSNTVTSARTSDVPYVSEWESPSKWESRLSQDNMIFWFNREAPQVTASVVSNGAVLVYSKDFEFRGTSDTYDNEPHLLPFYAIKPYIKELNPPYWYPVISTGNIQVNVRVYKTYIEEFHANGSNSKFRYFVFTPEVLNERGWTAEYLQSLSYTQLVQLLGVAP